MLGLKGAHLEINGYQTSQAAVKEEQIEMIVAVSYRNPVLPIHEAKVSTQLEEKLLEVLNILLKNTQGILETSLNL